MSRPKYKWSYPIPNGYIIVGDYQDKLGIITEQHKLVIPIIYDWICTRVTDNVTPMRVGRLYGLINVVEGVEIIPPAYALPFMFHEGLAKIYVHKLYGFINTKGEIVIPTLFNDVTPFIDWLATVIVKGVLLYIDKDLNYYNRRKELLKCGECPYYNDKMLTQLCCKFKVDL